MASEHAFFTSRKRKIYRDHEDKVEGSTPERHAPGYTLDNINSPRPCNGSHGTGRIEPGPDPGRLFPVFDIDICFDHLSVGKEMMGEVHVPLIIKGGFCGKLRDDEHRLLPAAVVRHRQKDRR
jgi:hypothetical protein